MTRVVGSFARTVMATGLFIALAAQLPAASASPNQIAQATPTAAAPAQPAPVTPSQPTHPMHDSHRGHGKAHHTRAESVEVMIAHMRSELQITAAQQGQFDAVADVMRANAKTMEALLAERTHDADRSAVDSVLWYERLTEAHAAALKNFSPVFEKLYTALADPQRKTADRMFAQLGERPFTPKSR